MKAVLIAIAACSILSVQSAQADYQPVAEKVVDNVYAIVGPTDQRSPDNDGLNANYGFIVTAQGVIMIDAGASRLGAEKLTAAIGKVTRQPVRWLVDTGSQDHRWLGKDYFASHGAEIIAMKRTAPTQADNAHQEMESMNRFLGDQMKGTKPMPASHSLDGNDATIELGGEKLVLHYTNAHFPGDAWVWLPAHNTVFTGDQVFVDRILGVLPPSNVRNGQRAFHELEALNPAHIVPGHGSVCDLAKAKRDTGDYYDFLVDKIAPAAHDMEDMEAVLDRYADLPAFRHLGNYDSMHRANMNRAYTEFISE